ncbi:MAG: acylphosphatase [Planctomycetes bacterium]|nr:acylphosphatase [Planctomycetota bacterium]NBY03637.1 acylphosphatase [Planctomycetota bacterium]
MPDKNLHCIKAIYSGLVQGVGFRQTVLQIAQYFDLHGRVKNLQNGTVELTAEGDKEKVDSFLKMIENTFGNNITDLQVNIIPSLGYVDYKIEY